MAKQLRAGLFSGHHMIDPDQRLAMVNIPKSLWLLVRRVAVDNGTTARDVTIRALQDFVDGVNLGAIQAPTKQYVLGEIVEHNPVATPKVTIDTPKVASPPTVAEMYEAVKDLPRPAPSARRKKQAALLPASRQSETQEVDAFPDLSKEQWNQKVKDGFDHNFQPDDIKKTQEELQNSNEKPANSPINIETLDEKMLHAFDDL